MKKNAIRKLLTKDQKRRIDARHKAVLSGKLRPWLSPNSSEEFSEERALQNLKKVVKAGHVRRLMKKMQGVYGS